MQESSRPNGKGGSKPATPRKRKVTVYNPAGHLGMPTQERLAKSNGYDEDNIAGSGPKVPRAVEKAPYTTDAVRLRIVAEEIDRAKATGRVPDPRRKLTPLDRALEEAEFQALDWWVETNYRRETGRPATSRFDDTPRIAGAEGGSDTREMRWRVNLSIITIVDEALPEAYREFLEMLTWMVHPDFREGRPPSQHEIGQFLIKITGKDASQGAFRGYTRAVAQMISSARADAAIVMRRRREAKEQAIRNERKVNGATHFRVRN